jgi:methionyl-tRNA formyltransferase
MYMDEGLDTGDMLLQTRIAIAPDATGGSLHHRLAELAPDALREALRQLADRTAPRIPQDPALATYAPKLEREHGRIDWNEPAELIERKIRAFDPWPGTYTIVRERKLKIFTASITSKALPPAEVAVIGEELLIGARDGSLRIGELQVEAKKRMRAADFIRGNPWIVGARCD